MQYPYFVNNDGLEDGYAKEHKSITLLQACNRYLEGRIELKKRNMQTLPFINYPISSQTLGSL